MSIHNHGLWVNWVDRLSDEGYVVIDDFLSLPLYQELQQFLMTQLSYDRFEKAGIGALDQNQIEEGIRGDFTYWLDKARDQNLSVFFDLVEETIQQLNRLCFLSLSGYEFHLAHYPKGSFYKKHLDQFNNRSNRMISMIIYLNPSWEEGDGGELKIYHNDGNSTLIEPYGNRCILFKSAEVLHEVLPTAKSRYSATGWLLYQPSGIGYLFG